MNCIVCRNLDSINRRQSDDFFYDCPNCGKFKLASYERDVVLPEVLTNHEKRAILSHAIWKLQRKSNSNYPRIVQIEKILQTCNLPNPPEQLNNLILWLGEHNKYYAENKRIELSYLSAKIGAIDTAHSIYVYQSLIRSHPSFLEEHPEGNKQLTLAGWQKYRDMKLGLTGNRKSVMAMKYDNIEMNSLFNDLFQPAVEETGFELSALDEEPIAGIVNIHTEVKIRNSGFLIADITHDIKRVYWEAGFASGLDKPVFYTCREDKTEDIHFDTDHRLFVKWNPDEPEKAAQRLKDVIRATLPTIAKMED